MRQSEINLDLHKPQVMAILNVTPDSFYGDSRTFTTAEIERRVVQIVAEGASIIDIGGYSSRPGAKDVSMEEEWRRVERGLSVVHRLAPSITVSIDSFRSEVAQRAVEQFGAVIINDISAGELDPRLIEIAAQYKLPYIAMHMRGTPQTMQEQANYLDVVDEVVDYFRAKVLQLKEAGVETIIIDPGFGFAKSLDQNYELLAQLSRLSALGYPLLSALSRKSMIYKPLGVTPDEALAGTIALNWESLRQGASIIRVHDVREAVDIVNIFNRFKA